MIRIIGVGDIMPGGVLNGTTKEFVSSSVLALLESGDFRIGTLETAIGNTPSFYEEKMKRQADVIYAEDEDLARLKELNINVVSLANNHFYDLGYEGALHTIELLDQYGIKHCGAGRNLEEASRPVVLEKKGKTIAILAFCDWRRNTTGWCPFATKEFGGVNPMYDSYVVEEIKKYRPQYDYIIVVPHWGVEYDHRPTSHVYRTSQKMLNAGADLVLGGHTHCVQPVMNINGRSVVFSMGNFLFPDRLICPPRSTYYPHSLLDIGSLPTTEGYPYVKKITFKKWKEIARTGLIAISTLSEQGVNTEVEFTNLTSDNTVICKECPPLIMAALAKSKKELSGHSYIALMKFREFVYFFGTRLPRFLHYRFLLLWDKLNSLYFFLCKCPKVTSCQKH